MKLNKTTFNQLAKPKKHKRVVANNHQGILIETTPSKRSLYLKYQSPLTLKTRQIKLESFNYAVSVTAKDIANALNKAVGYREQINKGHDPLEEKKLIRAAVKSKDEEIKNRVVLESVWVRYEKMERFTKLSKNTQGQYRSAYYNHLSPDQYERKYSQLNVSTFRG